MVRLYLSNRLKNHHAFLNFYLTGRQIWNRTIDRSRLFTHYPKSLLLEVTNRCNLRCAYCARDHVESVRDMDFALVKKIVDEFSTIRQRGMSISPLGLGEPLLYPRFVEVVRLIHHRIPEARISINTNATLLSESLSKDLIDSGMQYLVLGINCWDKDIYKRLHGADKFEQVVENVKRFLLMKRSTGAHIQILDIDVNKDSIQHFKNFWKPFLKRNDSIFVRPLTDFGGLISVDQFVSKSPPLEKKKRYPCPSPFTMAYLNKEGFIYPCCFGTLYGTDTDLCLGNIKEVSLKDVYDKGEKIQKLRTLHKKKKYDSIYPCSVCDSWRWLQNFFVDIGSKWI
jgi:MoaA/NifB/PqqE/SkfB family radical SAM enzyme